VTGSLLHYRHNYLEMKHLFPSYVFPVFLETVIIELY
jgi:hypothetical protein